MASSLLEHSLYSMLILLLITTHSSSIVASNPAKGFVRQHIHESSFYIQRPYDVPLNQRYRFKDGVHKLWVFRSDKPHTPSSNTRPRTEIAIRGFDYSSGVWQFEGHGYVPRGTSGVCIMQVFGSAPPHATTLMLRVYDGNLMYYRDRVIERNIYNRWFKLNVIHDVEAKKLKIYIDGHFKYEAPGRGGHDHMFKCGVYTQDDASHLMESRWRNITILKQK